MEFSSINCREHTPPPLSYRHESPDHTDMNPLAIQTGIPQPYIEHIVKWFDSSSVEVEYVKSAILSWRQSYEATKNYVLWQIGLPICWPTILNRFPTVFNSFINTKNYIFKSFYTVNPCTTPCVYRRHQYFYLIVHAFNHSNVLKAYMDVRDTKCWCNLHGKIQTPNIILTLWGIRSKGGGGIDFHQNHFEWGDRIFWKLYVCILC